ncbi:uncharacterized protein METZ01_LOCUS381418, partial [marine metagenome]
MGSFRPPLLGVLAYYVIDFYFHG